MDRLRPGGRRSRLAPNRIAVIDRYRWQLLFADTAALLLTAVLGVVTFRRIVNPIRALETSVESIAAGDYDKAVPFTEATDETGGLARSIDVLKQGAAARDQQRWVKANVSRLAGELQRRDSRRRVRRAAAVESGADARRRRGGVLRVRRCRRHAAARRGLRPGRRSRLPSRSRSAKDSSANARASGVRSRSRIFRPTTFASAPVSGSRRPRRPSPCRRSRRTRCSACWSWRRSARSSAQEQLLLDELLPGRGHESGHPAAQPAHAGAARADAGAGAAARSAGGGARRREAAGRGSDGDEIDVPREHEPRDPHADERHHRPVAPRAQDAAHRRSSATT